MITRWHKFRTFLVLLTLTTALIYLIQQLYQIQLVEGEALREKAARQHRISFSLSPRRGIIYDRNRRKLAVNIPVDSIYAHPSQVESVKEAARKLSPILRISPAILQERLKSKRPFVWLARRREKGQGAKAEQLGLEGINYVEEVKRYYPQGELAAHLLGFVGMDGEGLEGLEFYYDDYLRGAPGRVQSERDAWGREILSFRNKYRSPLPGLHLVLTIDAVIQHLAEQELERAFQESQAQGAVIVIMEPETGAILAMANRPTYDPNFFSDYPPAWRRNRAITDGFEPGSTFKVITAAAALEEGLFQLEDKIYGERGSFRLNGRLIRDVHPHGWLTFKEVMGVSSNIGFAKIGEALGEDKLYYYISSFGFGAR
ncbi:penicillin-binding protein, partial [candidate division NPL-UPA2 bacterium]|nr:penicillin-binding protein [candidate division NPL-UPA2 bacterium]